MSRASDSSAENPDQAILEMFGQWCDLELLQPPSDDDGTVAQEMNVASDDVALAIAVMPVVGMTGLAVKIYVAIHAEKGGLRGNPRAIDLDDSNEELLSRNLMAGALADLMRLNPAVAELVGATTFIRS